MIYPDVSVEEWSRRYGFQIHSFLCEWCDTVYPLNRPFLMKRVGRKFAGLEMQRHGCEKTGTIYVITALDQPLEAGPVQA
jgi:hypothetical protein